MMKWWYVDDDCIISKYRWVHTDRSVIQSSAELKLCKIINDWLPEAYHYHSYYSYFEKHFTFEGKRK